MATSRPGRISPGERALAVPSFRAQIDLFAWRQSSEISLAFQPERNDWLQENNKQGVPMQAVAGLSHSVFLDCYSIKHQAGNARGHKHAIQYAETFDPLATSISVATL